MNVTDVMCDQKLPPAMKFYFMASVMAKMTLATQSIMSGQVCDK